MEDVAKWQYGDNVKHVGPENTANAYSWKVTLKNGMKMGMDLDGYAKAKYGPTASVKCDPKNAWSWNWLVPPTKVVSNVRLNKKQILGIEGGCKGKVTRRLKITAGYSSTKNISSDVHAKIKAEASAKTPLMSGTASAEASAGLKNSLELALEENIQMEEEIEIDMSQPCYVYQLECSCQVNGEQVSVASRRYYISSEPL